MWTAVMSVVGVVVVAVLTVVGGVAIYNTKDGQAQGTGPAELMFPDTPTGLIAVVDDDGSLGSVAVVVLHPSQGDTEARGGTIVPVPVSADASGGFGSDRAPLNETVELFGTSSLREEVSLLLGMSLDAATVLDAEQLETILRPLGPIDVTLPTTVTDSSGSEVAPAGPQTMDAATMAAVLAASDPSVPGRDRDQTSTAVWSAIATAVGPGLDTPLSLGASTQSTTPATSAAPVSSADTLLRQLGGGPVVVREVRSAPIMSVDQNPRGVDAVVLDRADVVSVLGHIAPGRVSAPNAGANVQVLSHYGDDQLPEGVTRFNVAYTAVKALLAADQNVLSVDTSSGEVGSATAVEVTNADLMDSAQSLSDVFGPIEVRVADHPVAGIDVIVTLGTDYLAMLNTAAATTTPATTAPAQATTAPAQATTGSEGTVAADGST